MIAPLSTKTSASSNLSKQTSTHLLEEKINEIEKKFEAKLKNILEFCDQLKTDNEGLQFVIAELTGLFVKVSETESRYKELEAENSKFKITISELKAEVGEIKSQLLHFKETSASLDKSFSVEQQELNNNIVIRGIDLTNTASDSEPTRVYESIRAHLGIENDEVFNPESVKVIPSSITKTGAAKTIQVRFRSVIAKRQFLQIRRSTLVLFRTQRKLF